MSPSTDGASRGTTSAIGVGRTVPLFRRILWILLILYGGMPAASSQDWVALKDGTVIQCEVAKEEDLAVYLKFKNGTIRVGREHIALLAREKANEFVPATDFEKEQAEKGRVPFEGDWVSARKRDQIMAKRYKAIKEKIDEIEKHQSWHHAYEIETRTAVIRSNAPRETVDFYEERWNAFSDYFLKNWKIKYRAGKKRKKALICIYKSEKDYQDIAQPPPNARGFFQPGTEELHTYHDRSNVQESLEVLFHEGTHLLEHYIEPGFRYPTWLSEGMAEYISACTYDGKEFIPGGLQDDRLIPLVQVLEGGSLMTVEEMINLPQLSFLERGGYPPAWAFVHLMLEDKRNAKKFMDFYLGLGRGKAKQDQEGPWKVVQVDALRDCFKKSFKKDIYSFQEEWHDHIRKLASELNARCYHFKGMIRLNSGDPAGARKDLQTAIDMGIDLPHCYYVMGMAALRSGDVQAAVNAIEQAIEKDPLNGSFYFGLGVTQYVGVPDGKEKGKALLDLALELEPENLQLQKRYDYFFSGGDVLQGETEDDDD